MSQLRAVIYARVSTEKQDSNTSLPSQLADCREYSTRNDLEVVAEFSEDYTGSVSIQDRPKGAQVFAMLESGEASVLVVTRIDRLARPKNEGEEFNVPPMIMELAERGIEIHTVAQGGKIKTDFGSLLMALIRSKESGDERRLILERMGRGKVAKLSAGKMMGGWAPFGYRFTDEKHEALEIVEDEAAIVRQIFTWMTRGNNGDGPMSMWQIAAKLTGEHIPTHRDRLGYKRAKFAIGTWTPSDVSRLLSRSVYCGAYEYTFKGQSFSVPTPPIVTQETFDKANAMREQNAHFAQRNTRGKGRYLVSGMIACGCGCDLSYTGHTDRHGRAWYVPLGKMTMNYTPSRCDGLPVPALEVETATVDYLKAATKAEAFENFLMQMARDSSSVLDAARAELAQITAEIEQCNAEAARLVDLVVSGDLVAAALADKSAALDSRHAGLVTRQEAKESEIAKLALSDDDVARYLQLRADIARALEYASREQIRAILRACGMEIVVKGVSITIRARAFDFIPPSEAIDARKNVRNRKTAQ